MPWTRKPELVAIARNIARSVPDRIVVVAFLDGSDGGPPDLVELRDDEPILIGGGLDGNDATVSSKSSSSS